MISRRALFPLSAAVAFLYAQPKQSADVVIYGATPGGIGAAVAAARLGRTVILSEYVDHIGGIVSNGLTNADIGKRQAVGGLFYEFTRRVVETYTAQSAENLKLCKDGYWYEANLAEKIFHEWISAQGGRIKLLLSHELKSVKVQANRLTAITLQSRATGGGQVELTAPVFIDATYEGDLAAMAGAPFRTGREARSEYNEPHAGKIYMKFREKDLRPGSTGEADEATQAYCFRFHVTNVPEKRIPIEKPANYNRDEYALTLEDIRAGKITKFREVIQVYAMPNGRFELNSDHVNPVTGIPRESLDLAEDNWPWPTATPAQREKLYQRYLEHNVGMIWLLQNDSEVPESLRADARQYGWHRDEWVNNRNMPRQVYVRQGRRIVGDYILTENDGNLAEGPLQRTKVQPTSIATIEWPFDPHGHHKYDPAHPGVREGYYFVDHPPFQVPYGALVPKKIDGLLVPVACSCSHVAYNALRMEPVFIVLGEACGVAAHLAIRHKTPVRKIPTAELQAILVERKGVITFYEDLPFTDPAHAAMQYLGARGLNPGYRANKGEAVTHASGAERLARILQFEGRMWKAPSGNGDQPLTGAELAKWLKEAGYKSESKDGALDLGRFSMVIYQAIRPRIDRLPRNGA